MTKTLTKPATTPRTGAVAALAAPGVAALVIAIVMVGWSPEFDDYQNVGDRLTDGLFALYLLTSIIGAFAAARAALAPALTARLLGAGYGLTLSAVVAMNVLGHEPSWFMFIAGPGQLLAVLAFLTWAVWGKRHGVLSLALALLCAVGGLTAIIGSRAGLSVLIAGFWFALAARRSDD